LIEILDTFSANVFRNTILLGAVALPRSLQKNHLNFWFRPLNQFLYLFNGLHDFAS
jgi:hypothetical protein